MGSKWLILWSLWAARLVRQPTLPVEVATGLLRGSVSPDGSHIRYTGIPYGVAERFQMSRPVGRWNGIFDAIDENIRCEQRFSNTWVTGHEDCLRVNVYTPLRRSDKPYPVMVFIHGGGFRDGSGSPLLYGPEYLIKHDVILVTFNYRLEILGFLCLGVEEAPGNMGLKDQVQALRWVKKNIRAFGGDPDSVTLFGESAGAASVSYHIVSPMSKGLFHRAIMESGSAVSPWGLQFEPVKTAFKLAKQMGVETESVQNLVEIFKSKTIKELLGTRVPRVEGDIVLSENIFVPCIEETIPGSETFISDSPYNLIAQGKFNKVPLIMGFNNAEGYMFVGKENDTTISAFNFMNSLPRDLIFHKETEKQATALKFKKLYFKDLDTSRITRPALAKYQGDIGIVFPVISTADLFMKNMKKSVFIYKFCRDGWMNLVKMLFGASKYPGATHADELFYIFQTEFVLPISFFEKKIITTMTTLWTNFAKFGNPTPEAQDIPFTWNPSTQVNPQVLVIDTKMSTASLWDDPHMLFLNETYSKYRRKFKLTQLIK